MGCKQGAWFELITEEISPKKFVAKSDLGVALVELQFRNLIRHCTPKECLRSEHCFSFKRIVFFAKGWDFFYRAQPSALTEGIHNGPKAFADFPLPGGMIVCSSFNPSRIMFAFLS